MRNPTMKVVGELQAQNGWYAYSRRPLGVVSGIVSLRRRKSYGETRDRKRNGKYYRHLSEASLVSNR